MTGARVKRKLSAILSADAAGYSCLMGDDAVSTVKTLEAYREMMSDLIEQFRGRVVDSPGDNLLAEFSSVVDAVQCAVEIHEVIRAKNEELSEDRRMLFRIGVNLGDVIEEGGRIYGDPQLSFDILKEFPNSTPPWTRNMGSDMRQLPEFKEWVREIGLVDYWRGTGKWPDLCHPVGDDDFVCE